MFHILKDPSVFSEVKFNFDFTFDVKTMKCVINRNLSKVMQLASRHMKRCSSLIAIDDSNMSVAAPAFSIAVSLY